MCKLFLINTLNAKLNPICYLLALLGAHHILHVSRVRVTFYRAKYFIKRHCQWLSLYIVSQRRIKCDNTCGRIIRGKTEIVLEHILTLLLLPDSK